MARSRANSSNGQNGRALRADYLQGDPAEPGPISGGTLALEPDGLLFRGPGHANLLIGIEALQGMTVSGARTRDNGTRLRGTTRVAAYKDDRPTVWEFAIDRSNGVALRERVNRALAGMGRPPLPFVEALYEFELPAPTPRPPLDRGRVRNGHGRRRRARRRPADVGTVRAPDGTNGNALEPNTETQAEVAQIQALKNREPAKVYRQPSRQRRIVFAIIAGVVALEIVVTLLVLFVF